MSRCIVSACSQPNRRNYNHRGLEIPLASMVEGVLTSLYTGPGPFSA